MSNRRLRFLSWIPIFGIIAFWNNIEDHQYWKNFAVINGAYQGLWIALGILLLFLRLTHHI